MPKHVETRICRDCGTEFALPETERYADWILMANLGFLVAECGEEKVIWRGPRQRG